MSRSLAERIALLPVEEQEVLLDGLDPVTLEFDPEFWLRGEQLEALHAEEWLTAYLAGRGAGKTRTGAEWTREKARTPMSRICLTGRTAADVRDVMVQGESGIVNVSPPSERPEYVPSLRRLVWPNGTVALTFSSEEPSQLRGPQFDYGWADELAAWKQKPDDSGLTAWDNMKIATRLGDHPQLFVTTTPKRIPVVRALVDLAKTDPHLVHLIRGALIDNAANLASSYIETMFGLYAGTAIERQELYGELLDAVEGALWQEHVINRNRMTDIADITSAGKRLTIVGVDPSVAAAPGDECGIIVVTGTQEREVYKRRAWVVDDRSLLAGPEEWAKVVVQTAKDWNGIVVAEKNQGHDLVRMAIAQVDPNIPLVMVNATKGKAVRAEPVVMAYEQNRVSHVGHFEMLEDEMTSWVPGESGYSPNRLDALVWACSGLLVDEHVSSTVGVQRAGKVPGGDRLTQIVPSWRSSAPSGQGVWRR